MITIIGSGKVGGAAALFTALKNLDDQILLLDIVKGLPQGEAMDLNHMLSEQGIDVKVILNYNPRYEATNEKCNLTKQYFEENGIEVKFIYSNWSYFCNIHNKGMIVDNKSVLISSINWNENSVTRNREAGIIMENEDVAKYYTDVFLYDWNLTRPQQQDTIESQVKNENTIYIVGIFTMTFALIARDWRKREWT